MKLNSVDLIQILPVFLLMPFFFSRIQSRNIILHLVCMVFEIYFLNRSCILHYAFFLFSSSLWLYFIFQSCNDGLCSWSFHINKCFCGSPWTWKCTGLYRGISGLENMCLHVCGKYWQTALHGHRTSLHAHRHCD